MRKEKYLNKIYGTWKIVDFAFVQKRMYYWQCQCISCRMTRNICITSLVHRSPPSCKGCKDLTGKVFKNWKVLKCSHKERKYQKYWLCRCICGAEKAVNQSQLLQKKGKRCQQCPTIRPSQAA